MDNASQITAATPGGVVPSPGGDLTGRAIGDFRVLRTLGQGGMGHVYLAEQISLKRKVALKLLRPDLAANPTSLARFRREAEAVARATHAHIVQVYAVGEQDGLHFMALEYIDGRTLQDYLSRKGLPPLGEALRIMRQAASALERAGELGIVHRDIKPENILLTRTGEVKVADFGLSRCLAPDQRPLDLTQSGVTMGTPLYMSPEQVEGRPLDCRSDIYSLGVTCYHLLAGQPPFRGQTAFEVALQHVQAQPRPLQEVRADLPTELCAIVGKMMAKNPDSRYQTCRELLRDLASVRDRPMGATADGVVAVSLIAGAASVPAGRTTTLAARHPRRRWLGWLVAASLLTSAMAGAGLAWMQLRKQAQPTPPNAATDLGNLEALFSKQKHEQFLKDAVEQYANPGDDAARVRLGTGHNIELALLYLEQWRLDEAGEFFQKLLKSPVEQYADLGRLGHAIVLALGNRAAESNREFLELLKDKRGRRVTPRAGLIFFDNPQLAQWVGRALDYNAANLAPEAMPSELAPFQKPWTGPNKRPGNGKVPGKGKQPDSVE